MKKRMVRPTTRLVLKHLLPVSEDDPTSSMIDCDSMTEVLHLADKGDSIYKLVKVGRVDKAGNYIPIKRRKK